MRKEHGLRALKMRVTRKRCIGMCFGEIKQRFLPVAERSRKAIDFVAQPQSQVRRDLIVSAASGMQLTPRVANHFHQTRLDKRMHVFGTRFVKIARISLSAIENGLER